MVVTVSKLVYQGWGLASLDGLKLFIPNTLPGDEVEVRLTQKKRRWAMAEVVKMVSPSPLRIQSPCGHYPACGGCQLLHVSYENQLSLKQAMLEDCKTQAPDLSFSFLPILPSQNNEFYRNKMEFSFTKEGSEIGLGLKKRGSYHEIVPTPTCRLLSQGSWRILAEVGAFFSKEGLSVWDAKENTGLLKWLMLRHSKSKNQYMGMLTVSDDHPCFEKLWETIWKAIPELHSLYLGVQNRSSGGGAPDVLVHLGGSKTLEEQLGPLSYQISPLSFFQTNTAQATVLYDTITRFADPKPSDIVVDLYCGTGTIGLYLASQVHSVIGIEENPGSIQDALENAKRNQISNATFITGKVRRLLKEHPLPKPTLVIADPPRAGMSPKELMRAAGLGAKRLIYVSCNPATLVRDLAELCRFGYTIVRAQPVDMFPNTYHVETVVELTHPKPTPAPPKRG